MSHGTFLHLPPPLRCDLEPVRHVTSLLGVPLHVTLLKPPPSTPEAVYQGWFKLEVGTIAGMACSFDVCGGVTVEQLKVMVQQAKGETMQKLAKH